MLYYLPYILLKLHLLTAGTSPHFLIKLSCFPFVYVTVPFVLVIDVTQCN